MGTITVRSADQVPWADVEQLFRSAADPVRCWCQRYKMAPRESWASFPAEERAARLHDEPGGLLAYVDGEPVGWCAVEPRNAYPRLLLRTRVPWDGRDENRADGSLPVELHVGLRSAFEAAGFRQVSHPTERQVVMRIELEFNAPRPAPLPRGRGSAPAGRSSAAGARPASRAGSSGRGSASSG